MGRMTGAGEAGFPVGVVDRDREPDPRRLRPPRSVHVLAVLVEPLRLLNEKLDKLDNFGEVLVVGTLDAWCVMKEESML